MKKSCKYDEYGLFEGLILVWHKLTMSLCGGGHFG